jgi:hypothetical protein
MMRQSPESSATGSELGFPPDSLPVSTMIPARFVPVQCLAAMPTKNLVGSTY